MVVRIAVEKRVVGEVKVLRVSVVREDVGNGGDEGYLKALALL